MRVCDYCKDNVKEEELQMHLRSCREAGTTNQTPTETGDGGKDSPTISDSPEVISPADRNLKQVKLENPKNEN